MTFFQCTVVVTGLATMLASEGVAQEPGVASVKVLVRDLMGVPIPDAKVTLTTVGQTSKFTGTGAEATFQHIAFGEYDMEVRLLGFVTKTERLRIYQASVVLHVGLELGANHSYLRAELTGSVIGGLQGRRDLWVRLIGLYSSEFIQNEVDASGHFELDGMAHGRDLILLLEHDKVLATKPIDIVGGKQTVELTFGSK